MLNNNNSVLPDRQAHEAKGNVVASSTASLNDQISSYLEEFVTDTEALEMASLEETDENLSPSETAMAPLGTLKVIIAHAGSDAGGTVNLGQIEPFCDGVRKMPMYTVFEAEVLLPDWATPVVLYGYKNRRCSSTSYWGNRFITNGKKPRVVWEEDKLVPLPGKAESITLTVIRFALRGETILGKAVA